MPVELGALNQTHHRSRPLPRPQGTGEQPVVATDGNRSNLVLYSVVIDWQSPIIQKLRERTPALETVIECFGGG
jgi:hypothetical protein